MLSHLPIKGIIPSPTCNLSHVPLLNMTWLILTPMLASQSPLLQAILNAHRIVFQVPHLIFQILPLPQGPFLAWKGPRLSTCHYLGHRANTKKKTVFFNKGQYKTLPHKGSRKRLTKNGIPLYKIQIWDKILQRFKHLLLSTFWDKKSTLPQRPSRLLF